MFGVKFLVWLNATTSRLDITQLPRLSSSPFLPLTKKTTPNAAAATAAAPTMVKHDLSEDNVVRGSGREEEEGEAASPLSPPPLC